MEFITLAVDMVLHANVYLDAAVEFFGLWSYALLFLIIFLETGVVVTPFLPGDSLLFAAGAIAAGGSFNIFALLVVIFVAAVVGDMVNYWIGKYAGNFLLTRYPTLIKQKHLDKTHEFFERYGGKTIILCRFVPIVRTLAPFVAGAGAMTYSRYMRFNIVGGALWTVLLTLSGFFFANIPFVEENFSLVLVGIVGVSFLPAIFEYLRERRKRALGGA